MDTFQKVLSTKYKLFANGGSVKYLYEGFKYNMVYRLVSKLFTFSTRAESNIGRNEHLKEDILIKGLQYLF